MKERRFNFNNQQILVITVDGEPWFVAKDVCAILDIANFMQALRHLDEGNVKLISLTDTVGREQVTSIISKFGMFTLALASRDPGIEVFRKWLINTIGNWETLNGQEIE